MSTRDDYVEKMKTNLDAWNASIDNLEAKARVAEADAQNTYNEQIEALRKQRDDASAKLGELRAAGDDAWEDLRTGMETAWDSLDKAMKSAASRFR